MEELTEQKGLNKSTKSTWKELAPKIISQAHLDSHSHSVDLALKMIGDCEGKCICIYVYMCVCGCMCIYEHFLSDYVLCGSSWLG